MWPQQKTKLLLTLEKIAKVYQDIPGLKILGHEDVRSSILYGLNDFLGSVRVSTTSKRAKNYPNFWPFY